MRMLVVLNFDMPQDPEAVVAVLDAIDPQKLPYFAGSLRLVVDPYASTLLNWLDTKQEEVEVIDPDCRDGKHGSCMGGPCGCPCHLETEEIT